MTTAYTNLLGLALPIVGELDGTWGTTLNNAITQLVEDAVANTATASVTSSDWTLSTLGSGASNEARMAVLIPTGTPSVSRNIIAPAHSKTYIVVNQSNAVIVLKGASTTGVTVLAGLTALIVWNGSDFTTLSSSVNSGVGTNITGLVKGNGTLISVATAETDYVTPTGVGVISGKTVTGLKLTKTAPTISAGVLSIDCSSGSAFAVSLNAAITSFTMTNTPTSGTYYEFLLEFTADGTARAITWTFSGTAVKWAAGTVPTMTSTLNKKDVFVFYTYDAGTNWLGFKAGQNL